jgi:hypothetical protein
MDTVKVTVHYGADLQLEIWFEGPYSAAGSVLDHLLDDASKDRGMTSITVVPNPTDFPTRADAH